MKTSKVTVLLTASLLGVVGAAISTQAADPGTTTGKVNFIEGTIDPVNDPLDLIKPGTANEAITMKKETGVQTSGGLRFTFVPNLDFGTAKISISDQTLYAKSLEYSTKKTPVTKGFLPPFVQVVNESGVNTRFQVKVKATKFKSTTTQHELGQTAIQLKDFKAKNSTLDKTVPNGDAATGYLTIPDISAAPDKAFVIGTDAKQLFSSTNGDKTLGNASSVVFQDTYTLGDNIVENTPMKSVSLVVPASDTPKKETYTSTLTWELINAD